MATTIEVHGVRSGLTLTAHLFPNGSDTEAGTGASCTQATHRTDCYTFAASGTGLYKIRLVDGSSRLWWTGWVMLATSGTIVAEDSAAVASRFDEVVTAISAIQGSAGSGARTVSVTVTDATSGDPIQGVTVRMTANGFPDSSDVTGSVGTTELHVDDALWSWVAVARSGYASASGTIDIRQDEPLAITMTATSYTQSDPENTTLTLHVRDLSPMADAANVPVTVRLLKLANGSIGEAYAQNSVTENSDTNGDVEFLDFPRGATCQVRIGLSTEAKWVTFVTADGPLTNIAGAII